MAFYVVEETAKNKDEKPKQHLVEAKTQEQAIKAVVTPRFTVRVAEPSELITLTKNGVELIKA